MTDDEIQVILFRYSDMDCQEHAPLCAWTTEDLIKLSMAFTAELERRAVEEHGRRDCQADDHCG